MVTNLERFKKDLEKLISLGKEMEICLIYRKLSEESKKKLTKENLENLSKNKSSFEDNYQKWYSESLILLKQLLPDRLQEFIILYQGDGKRKNFDLTTYNIQDWLKGLQAKDDLYGKKIFDDLSIVTMNFRTQFEILKCVESRFESSLFDIAQLVRADLFDSELEAARELVKHGFLRGAGAIAGVVVEKHLAQVCVSHNVITRKQHPTISDFNDILKTANVLDVPTWRQIQRLGDIRNLCDHNKQREPTKDEVNELVDSTEKLCKTLF